MVWLARQVGCSAGYVRSVKSGLQEAGAPFRAKCALLLGAPEADLFVTAPRPYPAAEEVSLGKTA